MAQRTFYSYFKEGMNGAGLPAPDSLFGGYERALATIGLLVAAVKKLGTSVTIAELVGATIVTEKLLVVGALGASYYAGACIGALAFATGQWSADKMWASNTMSVGELVNNARRHGIVIPREIQDTLHLNSNLRTFAVA